MQLLSPDARDARRLAVGLALLAGYIDSAGIQALDTFVSFMSGNTTRNSSLAGLGNFASAPPYAVAIGSFVAGPFAGTWLALPGLRQARQLLFGAVAALLAAVVALVQSGPKNRGLDIATLTFAMGMFNNTLSRVGFRSVSVTVATGLLHGLSSHLALPLKRAPLADAMGPWDTHLRRAILLATVWTAFFSGAAGRPRGTVFRRVGSVPSFSPSSVAGGFQPRAGSVKP